jgi:hypothetical protein
MPKFKFFQTSSVIIALALLFLVLLTSHNEAETPRDPLSFPPHIGRGNRVARHYDAYSRQLAQYHASLARALKEMAPELLVHLQPREPILHGYQILPRITVDAGAAKYVNLIAAYSWPWTDHLIDGEQRNISRSEAELGRTTTMTSAQGRAVLQRLALDYHKLSQQHRNLDAHVQYNRLWQAAIAANRLGYNHETELYDRVFEHQKIVERLARMRATFERSNIAYNRPLRLEEITAGLRARETLLHRRIDQALGQVNTPDFVKVENSGDEWIVRVPLFTDIHDRAFVARAKEIIETTWRLTERNSGYRVELDVSFISTDVLYVNQKKPVAGQKLDIRRHLKRFPAGAAILTTGALTTHVQDNAVVLGPHDLSPRVLAHEFGHILGFRDLYIRGYRDLAEDGFQVMEIVSNPEDIMAATPRGMVLPSHFSRLIKSTKPLSDMSAAPEGKKS